MNQRSLRALQVLGAAPVTAICGMLIWQCRGEGLTEALAVALTAACMLGIGLNATLCASASAGDSADSSHSNEKTALDRELNAAIERVAAALRRHIASNLVYNTSLTDINDNLSRFPPRAEVREIIVELMNSNFEMQSKVASLSKELEASQQQIVSLRNNVSEVGKIAMLDALTQLGNRRYFDHTLEGEIARARADGGDLCLAMADLDRFKAVNDRFGHVVGDHLLRLFADLLAHKLKGKGTPTRYGGEEFALLFAGVSLEETKRLVDGVRRDLEGKSWVVGPKEERLGKITASFGIARLGPDEAAESFVRRADAKLLEAKSSGRNRVMVDETGAPMRAERQTTTVVD